MCPPELVYYISIHFFSTRRKLHLLFYVLVRGVRISLQSELLFKKGFETK